MNYSLHNYDFPTRTLKTTIAMTKFNLSVIKFRFASLPLNYHSALYTYTEQNDINPSPSLLL